MIFLVQALLIPWLIGFLFIGLFRMAGLSRAFKIFLAAGIGFGISSCGYFVLLLVARPWQHGIALVDYVLLAGLVAANLYLREKPGAADRIVPATGGISRVLLAGFLAVAALAAAVFVMHLVKFSHGGWDAWAIWNLRARFLFRGGEHWKDAFSTLNGWNHPDYPVLIPGLVARCWEYMGRESVVAPALIAALFTVATIGLLACALAARRGLNQALVGGLLLAGTPLFMRYGADQYADVPLAFYFLATVVLLYFQDRSDAGSWAYGALAGCAAGFAAWTKNEGLLFIPAIVLARVGITRSAKKLAPFLAGLAPALLLTLYFKIRLVPEIGLPVAMPDSRTAMAFVLQVLSFGNWYFSPVLLLVIYGLCLGVKLEAMDKPTVWTVAAILLVMAATGTGISTMDRVVLQLWPSLLFACLLVIRAPERIPLAPEKRREKSKKRRNSPSLPRVK